jgi:hypothetical protein
MSCEQDEARTALGIGVAEWGRDRRRDPVPLLVQIVLRVDWMVAPRGPGPGELTVYASGGSATFDGHATLAGEVDAIPSGMWNLPQIHR